MLVAFGCFRDVGIHRAATHAAEAARKAIAIQSGRTILNHPLHEMPGLDMANIRTDMDLYQSYYDSAPQTQIAKKHVSTATERLKLLGALLIALG
jgi:hypothetical protein